MLPLTSIVTEPNTEEMDPATARAIAIVRLFSPSKSWLPLMLDITIANISSVKATHWKRFNCISLEIVVTTHFQNTEVDLINWNWSYTFHTITGIIHQLWLNIIILVPIRPKSIFDRCLTPLIFIVFKSLTCTDVIALLKMNLYVNAVKIILSCIMMFQTGGVA